MTFRTLAELCNTICYEIIIITKLLIITQSIAKLEIAIHEITIACIKTCASVILISSYGAPLAQRASYLVLHGSLFGPDGAVNYDCIITNSINCFVNCLKMYSQWHTH